MYDYNWEKEGLVLGARARLPKENESAEYSVTKDKNDGETFIVEKTARGNWVLKNELSGRIVLPPSGKCALATRMDTHGFIPSETTSLVDFARRIGMLPTKPIPDHFKRIRPVLFRRHPDDPRSTWATLMELARLWYPPRIVWMPTRSGMS